MAKFRRNHSSGGRNSSGSIIKSILGMILVAGVLYFTDGSFLQGEDEKTPTEKPKSETKGYEIKTLPSNPSNQADGYGNDMDEFRDYLPKFNKNIQPLARNSFAIGYSEEHEQAAWVAYELSEKYLARKTKRKDAFRQDKSLKTGSAHPDDYRGSGFSRGHLIAAADRTGSAEWMNETFLMSNMSPQEYNMNGGIWRELEELIRSWAKYHKKLYVITGPDLTDVRRDKIGKYNEISVPNNYYKVIWAPNAKGIKAIGFYIPNKKSTKPLTDYAMTIDEVESRTGLDFFALISDDLEEKIEKDKDISDWRFYDDKFKKRVDVWNNY